MPSITLFIAWTSLQSCHYLQHSKTKLWTPHCLSIKNRNISKSLDSTGSYFDKTYNRCCIVRILLDLSKPAQDLTHFSFLDNIVKQNCINIIIRLCKKLSLRKVLSRDLRNK